MVNQPNTVDFLQFNFIDAAHDRYNVSRTGYKYDNLVCACSLIQFTIGVKFNGTMYQFKAKMTGSVKVVE